MALPTSRTEFKKWCLRALGHPTIKINVSDEATEDRIDEALQFYWDYHFDGTEKMYYKHLITTDDITNKYITMPENIIGVVNLFDIGTALSSENLFSIRYQIALNELYTLTSSSLVPYYMAIQHLGVIEELLVGRKPIRYNRNRNILYIDTNWSLMPVDTYLVVEAYQIVDPDTYPDVWKDRWLLEYATVLIKEIWGQNMKKYQGLRLPGGLVMNGQQMYDEAVNQKAKMREDMIHSYSLPCLDMVG